MKQPSKVLDDKLNSLTERLEQALSGAFERVTEEFIDSIESLVDEFGAPEVGDALRHYSITVWLPKTLEDAFGPIEPDQRHDEE